MPSQELRLTTIVLVSILSRLTDSTVNIDVDVDNASTYTDVDSDSDSDCDSLQLYSTLKD